MPSKRADLWKQMSLATLDTAKSLRDHNDCRSCVSRIYYACYQAATAVCIAHGDAPRFRSGWNNPSHDQLPELIRINSDLPQSARPEVARILRTLRKLREDSDYRPGQTVDTITVTKALLLAAKLFDTLGIYDDER